MQCDLSVGLSVSTQGDFVIGTTRIVIVGLARQFGAGRVFELREIDRFHTLNVARLCPPAMLNAVRA